MSNFDFLLPQSRESNWRVFINVSLLFLVFKKKNYRSFASYFDEVSERANPRGNLFVDKEEDSVKMKYQEDELPE